MTLDTPHRPFTVFEKMPKKCGKNKGENYFLPTLVFDSKTRSQFRPACKNQKEISKNEVRSLLWPLGGGKCGKGGGNGIRRGEMHYRIQN